MNQNLYSQTMSKTLKKTLLLDTVGPLAYVLENDRNSAMDIAAWECLSIHQRMKNFWLPVFSRTPRTPMHRPPWVAEHSETAETNFKGYKTLPPKRKAEHCPTEELRLKKQRTDIIRDWQLKLKSALITTKLVLAHWEDSNNTDFLWVSCVWCDLYQKFSNNSIKNKPFSLQSHNSA